MFEAYKIMAEAPEDLRGDAGQTALDALKAVGGAYANNTKLETTLFSTNLQPFKEGGAEKAKSAGDTFGKLLKPKVTVTDSLGHEQFKWMPYGEPKDSSGTVKAGVVAAVLVLGGATFAAGRLSKRCR